MLPCAKCRPGRMPRSRRHWVLTLTRTLSCHSLFTVTLLVRAADYGLLFALRRRYTIMSTVSSWRFIRYAAPNNSDKRRRRIGGGYWQNKYRPFIPIWTDRCIGRTTLWGETVVMVTAAPTDKKLTELSLKRWTCASDRPCGWMRCMACNWRLPVSILSAQTPHKSLMR